MTRRQGPPYTVAEFQAFKQAGARMRAADIARQAQQRGLPLAVAADHERDHEHGLGIGQTVPDAQACTVDDVAGAPGGRVLGEGQGAPLATAISAFAEKHSA